VKAAEEITRKVTFRNKLLDVRDVALRLLASRNEHPRHKPRRPIPNKFRAGPRLLSNCPHCHQPLRFNPFIVDNRDRY